MRQVPDHSLEHVGIEASQFFIVNGLRRSRGDRRRILFLEETALLLRALVGVCVAVGEGKLEVADAERLRAELERSNEFAVMPARGLTLAEVGYPADALLGQRAELTRQRRSLGDGPDPFAEFDPDDDAG